MFNKVVLTFSTRILTALLSIVNVLIGTNYLGVEGYGTISLIILGITIYLMIQNIVTGSSIVYYTSKFKSSSILTLSYAWTIFSIVLFAALVFFTNYFAQIFNWTFELVPASFMWHNVLLAGGYGLMAIHLNILLGKERIKAYNFIFFIQHLIASLMLVLFFIFLEKDDILYYIIALYTSYFSAFIMAFILTSRYLKSYEFPKYQEFTAMLKYGILGQGANIFQLVNYRLSYYLIDFFAGRASLGVFSAATQLSEGLWIFGKSIATVQFAHLSNKRESEYAKNLTLKLVKFTTVITIIPLLILVFIPIPFYTNFIGNEFEDVRLLIRLMSLGTITLAASRILSSYFSGTGKIVMNTKASGLGVMVTLVVGIVLVPQYGAIGASITTTLTYLFSLLYLLYYFNIDTKPSLKEWLLSKNDLSESWQLIRSKIKKK